MAIEIKRTPVLEGNAAQAFVSSISQTHTTRVSGERVRNAVEISKKILEAYKAKNK